MIGFQIVGAPDVSSYFGEAGTWLIDPYNITVTNSRSNDTTAPDGAFVSNGTGDAEIDVEVITTALRNADVIIRTQGESGPGNGNITFDRNGDLNYDGRGARTLTLDAAGDIAFEAGSRIFDRTLSGQDSLNVVLLADGAVTLAGEDTAQSLAAASITTQGGQFTVGSETAPVTSFTNNGTITTTGAQNQDGGDITIYTSGTLTSTGLTANGGAAGNNTSGRAAGSITLDAGTGITLTGSVTATGSQGDHGYGSGAGGAVLITSATGPIDIQAGIEVSGGNGNGDAARVSMQEESGAVKVLRVRSGFVIFVIHKYYRRILLARQLNGVYAKTVLV